MLGCERLQGELRIFFAHQIAQAQLDLAGSERLYAGVAVDRCIDQQQALLTGRGQLNQGKERMRRIQQCFVKRPGRDEHPIRLRGYINLCWRSTRHDRGRRGRLRRVGWLLPRNAAHQEKQRKNKYCQELSCGQAWVDPVHHRQSFRRYAGLAFRNRRASCSARATPGPCQKRLKTARTSRYSGQTASPDDTFVSPSQKGCPVEGRRHDIPSALRHCPLASETSIPPRAGL